MRFCEKRIILLFFPVTSLFGEFVKPEISSNNFITSVKQLIFEYLQSTI